MGISLYHYSEEPNITEFVPRPATSYPELDKVVWALDADFEPLYLFPRDCPRVAFWALPESRQEDIERFFGQTAATLVQSIESAWLERLRATTIYRYEMPPAPFERDASPGCYGAYLSRETVRPVSVEPIPDLLAAHTAAGSELRITPSPHHLITPSPHHLITPIPLTGRGNGRYPYCAMFALLWLLAISLSLVALTYVLSAVIASVRAGKPVFVVALTAAGVALVATLFGRLNPLIPAAAAIAAGLGGMAALRRVTRNPQHAAQTVSLSAAHLTLLAGTFLFLIPFAWLISTSLKTDEEQAIFPPVWIPTQQVELPSPNVGLQRPDGKPLKLSRLADGTEVAEVEDLPSGEVVVQPLLGGRQDSDKPQLTVKRDQLTKIRHIAPRWENYSEALTYLPKETYYGLTFLKNTLILTIMGVIGTVLSSSLVAYAFARLRFPGKNALFIMVLATMMVPAAVTMMPQFLIFRNLGWIDTLRPLWVPAFFGSAFNIFLLRQFFLSIPTELEDAARIDGCGPFGIYWRVMLPLVKPALAAIAIFGVLGAWNNFQGPLIYLSSPENMPMAYGLQLYQQQHSGEPGLLMAASTMVILPIILLFFFTQRYFIEGVSLTGMGGR